MDIEVSEEVKKKNRELCREYPFLIPRNRWSGKRITEAQDGGFWPRNPDKIPEYDYEYTELDDMPDGWRKAFGEQLCAELKKDLMRSGGKKALDEYMIWQIKEKYGSLRWYDSGGTDRWYKKVLPKYEYFSMMTCIGCGKPATQISTGWISPWCDDCAKTIHGKTVPIKEWYELE